MRNLVSDTLLLSHKQLREKYTNHGNDPGVVEVRVRETEMQTLLRLEMEAAAPTDISASGQEKKKKDEEDDGESDDDDSDLPEALQDMVDEVIWEDFIYVMNRYSWNMTVVQYQCNTFLQYLLIVKQNRISCYNMAS